MLPFSILTFHRIGVETSVKYETIISNVSRIHRNYAERASSELAADGSCYATLVETANSDTMCQLLCNDGSSLTTCLFLLTGRQDHLCSPHRRWGLSGCSGTGVDWIVCLCVPMRLVKMMNPPLCFVFPRATMSERKAVIKNADMSEDMQQDAVECATQALEKYNIEKDIAAYIKKVKKKKKKKQLLTHPTSSLK